jgi:hypothetical protein
MMTKLRIWRVVPTSDTGAKAPYYFVETEKFKLEVAEWEAIELAKQNCMLSKFNNWNFSVTKLRVRKDGLGRYWTYHQ